MNKGIYFIIALPILLFGLAFFSVAIYHGAQGVFGLLKSEQSPWEMALWPLFFSFAATSLSTFVASKVKFVSNEIIRKVHKYSLIVVTVFFLGYVTLGALSGFVKIVFS